jgi:transposase
MNELLLLVKSAPVPKTYSIDKLFVSAEHTVLHLPPYHCDLNPIELVWGDIKGRVGEVLTENMSEKKELCLKLFSEYTSDKWKKCC